MSKEFALRVARSFPPLSHAVSLGRAGVMLWREGWFRSCLEGRAVDADGRARPWMTYPALDYLSRKDCSLLRVFEYGAGQSTLWWGLRVRELVSCEHDSAYADALRPLLPPNAQMVVRPLSGQGVAYSDAPSEFPPCFDLIVVDGRRRVECLRRAPAFLCESGALILDDSQRPEYAEGVADLLAQGFRGIDFWGFGPVNGFKWCTSLFYRGTGGCFP